MADNSNIEEPQALRNVLDNLSPAERAELAVAKASKDKSAVVQFMNAKFATLPAEQEAEIRQYFDKKNCAQLGIPYRSVS